MRFSVSAHHFPSGFSVELIVTTQHLRLYQASIGIQSTLREYACLTFCVAFCIVLYQSQGCHFLAAVDADAVAAAIDSGTTMTVERAGTVEVV